MVSVQLENDISAWEAALASVRPRENAAQKEHVKSNVLLEAAKWAETEIPPLSREKLIETIVKSGEPEITLSLTEYVKTVRTGSRTQGILIGLVLGFIVGVFGTVWLSSQQSPPVPFSPRTAGSGAFGLEQSENNNLIIYPQ